MIEIVIKLTESDYEMACKDECMIGIYGDAIRSGIVLPKEHGRLIDASQLSDSMYHEAFETDTDLQRWDSGCWIRYKMFENQMDATPTIVPWT